jgi:hypothetical protein
MRTWKAVIDMADTICKCGNQMVFVFCWDNAQQTDRDHAFNVYGCDSCGRIFKEDVWEDKGELWIGLEGPEEKVADK